MKLEDLEGMTLETLITRHRDRFDLRYSTDQDVHSLICDGGSRADGMAVTNTLYGHVLITLKDSHRPDNVTFLTGVRPGGFIMTSPVVHLNLEQGWAITKSGSLYLLDGRSGDIPMDFEHVLAVAGIFNSWGIGQQLGMPDVFF